MRKIYLMLFFLACIPVYCQWVSQISGVTQNLNDVYCINENFVVTVGDNGTILKTANGGLNWIQKTSGTIQKLMKVQFANQNIGYAVGENGILLKTSDGGENWLTIPTELTTNFWGLSVLNENTFFVSGDIGLVLKSNNGGLTFSTLSQPTNQNIPSIQFFNEQTGYVLSKEYMYDSDYELFKTSDGGIHWNLASTNHADLSFFLNENIGFISSNGSFSRTIDGGLNFTNMNQEIFGQERAIFSLNENSVWKTGSIQTLCGCGGGTYISKIDLNTNETLNNYFSLIPLNAIHFANETSGFTVGGGGTIYKNSTGTMIPQVFDINQFKKKSIQIYPNPTTGIVNFSKNIAIDSVEIFDNLDRTVKQFSNVENNILDLQNLSNGVYFCIVHSNGEKFTEKIIVDK